MFRYSSSIHTRSSRKSALRAYAHTAFEQFLCSSSFVCLQTFGIFLRRPGPGSLRPREGTLRLFPNSPSAVCVARQTVRVRVASSPSAGFAGRTKPRTSCRSSSADTTSPTILCGCSAKCKRAGVAATITPNPATLSAAPSSCTARCTANHRSSRSSAGRQKRGTVAPSGMTRPHATLMSAPCARVAPPVSLTASAVYVASLSRSMHGLRWASLPSGQPQPQIEPLDTTHA